MEQGTRFNFPRKPVPGGPERNSDRFAHRFGIWFQRVDRIQFIGDKRGAEMQRARGNGTENRVPAKPGDHEVSLLALLRVPAYRFL